MRPCVCVKRIGRIYGDIDEHPSSGTGIAAPLAHLIAEAAHPILDSPILSDTICLYLVFQGLLPSVGKGITLRGNPHPMRDGSQWINDPAFCPCGHL